MRSSIFIVTISIILLGNTVFAAGAEKRSNLFALHQSTVKDFEKLKNWGALKKEIKDFLGQSELNLLDQMALPKDAVPLPKVSVQKNLFSIKIDNEIVNFKIVDVRRGHIVLRGREVHLDPKISFQDNLERVVEVLSRKTSWHFLLPRAQAAESSLLFGKGLIVLVLYTKFRDRYLENTLKAASRDLENAHLQCNYLSMRPKVVKSAVSQTQREEIRKKLQLIKSDYCGDRVQEMLSKAFGSKVKTQQYGGTFARACELSKQITSCFESRVKEDVPFDFAEIQRTLSYVPLSEADGDSKSTSAVKQIQ